MTKKNKLRRRHLRVRRKVSGTGERPRLYVRKSLRHIYAQLIDDSPENGSRTLAIYTTASKDSIGKQKCNVPSAEELGRRVGSELKNRGINQIVFDRGGCQYHGVVKAFADAVRESEINF